MHAGGMLQISTQEDPRFEVARGGGVVDARFLVVMIAGRVESGSEYFVRNDPQSSWIRCRCTQGGRVPGIAWFERAPQVERPHVTDVRPPSRRKEVTVEIPPDQLRSLHAQGEMLCIAKKVASLGYNVVWWADLHYSVLNSFEWTPEFQIFGSNRFVQGEVAADMTGAIDMALGGHVMLDEHGRFGAAPAHGGGDARALNLTNRFGPLHIGINQRCVVAGTEVVAPIHLTSEWMMPGPVALAPIDRVLIWFGQGWESRTIFTHGPENAIEVDLTTVDAARVHYQDWSWTVAS